MRFLLLLIVLPLSSCYEVKRDCKAFKTGHFHSKITLDNRVLESTFIRYDTLQVEFFNGKIDSSSVRWINDCEMIFKTINPKNRAEKKDIHIKILSTTETGYSFEYGYVGTTGKQKGVATSNLD